MSDDEKKPLDTKQMYLKYLRGEATLEEVDATVEPTWNAIFAPRAAAIPVPAKQPE